MPIYKYFGQPAKYHGKPLFHILANLKDFGRGRIVTRSVFDADPEQSHKPSFYRILWAQPLMDADTKEGRVVAEKIRSGVRYTQPVDLANIAPVPDFRLVSRKDEKDFCKWDSLRDFSKDIDYVIEPKHFTIPPLLRLLMERNMKERGEEYNDDSFLLPHFKTYIPKDEEVIEMGKREAPRIEKHQETVTRCEGTAAYKYSDLIDPEFHHMSPETVEALLPEEPPMPSPAVGMRLYRWPNESKNHKEEVRTEEHSAYFP